MQSAAVSAGALSGALTIAELASLKALLDTALAQDRAVLDLSAVTQVDMSVLQLLHAAMCAAPSKGCALSYVLGDGALGPALSRAGFDHAGPGAPRLAAGQWSGTGPISS